MNDFGAITMTNVDQSLNSLDSILDYIPIYFVFMPHALAIPSMFMV